MPTGTRCSCMFSLRMHPAIFRNKVRINPSKIILLLVRARTGGQMLINEYRDLTRSHYGCLTKKSLYPYEHRLPACPFLWEQCGLRHEHLPLGAFLAERNLL